MVIEIPPARYNVAVQCDNSFTATLQVPRTIIPHKRPSRMSNLGAYNHSKKKRKLDSTGQENVGKKSNFIVPLVILNQTKDTLPGKLPK